MTKKLKPFEFEKSLEELEKLVALMEQGDLTLEESLKHFERGIALARSCQQSLAEAEQKVKILISNQGKEELEPFETEEP
jgi:exodeoxyribonuclease VII small subunit